MLSDILNVIAVEFSDLADTSEIARVATRLFVAAILGGILGFEREHKAKDAGIRTHMLVSVGAALFVIGPGKAGVSVNDMSRVIQGIIQGIGFLGAGTIMLGTADSRTRGLTSAASIWATAGIGIAAGMGMEATAVLATFILIFILSVVPYVTKAKYGNE